MIVNREHIGIFGKMNAGKSCVMNLLTQQETSIVDETPGTTADTKITLQEIHGLGPVKLFDTAGLDEINELGNKKRKKVLSTLKECDLILLVLDPRTNNLETEKTVIENARELDKQIIVIYNIFDNNDADILISNCENSLPILQFYQKIAISAIDPSNRQPLLNFILKHYVSKNIKMELLPFIEKDEFYILSGNYIHKEDTHRLITLLDKLKKMDKNELKIFYKEERRRERREGGKGGGLGTIETARKASRPLEYKLTGSNDEQHDFISIKAVI